MARRSSVLHGCNWDKQVAGPGRTNRGVAVHYWSGWMPRSLLHRRHRNRVDQWIEGMNSKQKSQWRPEIPTKLALNGTKQWTHLTDEHVRNLKVSPDHLGSLTGNWLDFYADLLAFSGVLHVFVVHFDAGNHAQIYELEKNTFIIYCALGLCCLDTW